MRIRTSLRHLREGFRNIIRNGWMTFASLSSIGISLFILGFFLLLTMNVNHIADNVEKQVEIRVYLDLNIAQDQIKTVQNEIGSMDEVAKVTFVSKEEGLKYLKDKVDNDWIEGFEGDNNPLPDSFTVEVHVPQEIAFVTEKIEQLNDIHEPKVIDKIVYGKGYVENLFKISNVVNKVGLVLVIGLAITAMFLIANTIKLTILARRKEIGIMKLVGATNNFIRWPFFVEGAILGLVGSAIPLVILLYGYHEILLSAQADLAFLMFLNLIEMSEIAGMLCALILGLGMFLGIIGTILSVRKHLKV